MSTDEAPRVLIRVITTPHAVRGERLAVYVDTRLVGSPQVLVYSITHDAWRTEPHRQIMWRSRRATALERAEAVESLSHIGERVRVLQSAPRAERDPADEVPVDPDDPV